MYSISLRTTVRYQSCHNGFRLRNIARGLRSFCTWLTHKRQKLLCKLWRMGHHHPLRTPKYSIFPNHLMFLDLPGSYCFIGNPLITTSYNLLQPPTTPKPINKAKTFTAHRFAILRGVAPFGPPRGRRRAAGHRPKRSFGPGSAPVQLEDTRESPPIYVDGENSMGRLHGFLLLCPSQHPTTSW